jgi:hypothetical protein
MSARKELEKTYQFRRNWGLERWALMSGSWVQSALCACA